MLRQRIYRFREFLSDLLSIESPGSKPDQFGEIRIFSVRNLNITLDYKFSKIFVPLYFLRLIQNTFHKLEVLLGHDICLYLLQSLFLILI